MWVLILHGINVPHDKGSGHTRLYSLFKALQIDPEYCAGLLVYKQASRSFTRVQKLMYMSGLHVRCSLCEDIGCLDHEFLNLENFCYREGFTIRELLHLGTMQYNHPIELLEIQIKLPKT